MSVVLITHDLGIVAERCDRVAVMYAGQVVETGPTAEVVAAPIHPYTQGLLRSMPSLAHLDAPLVPIDGTVPDPTRLSDGCRFLPRCPHAMETCTKPIDLRFVTAERAARCILAEAVR
jgi:peptide/nickel transport system ATP-binding protein/oligopeptide transport system ATP-binding protein